MVYVNLEKSEEDLYRTEAFFLFKCGYKMRAEIKNL